MGFEYQVTYIGMDQAGHTEIHAGGTESPGKLIVFLEERGAHMIRAEDVKTGEVVYDDGAFPGQ